MDSMLCKFVLLIIQTNCVCVCVYLQHNETPIGVLCSSVTMQTYTFYLSMIICCLGNSEFGNTTRYVDTGYKVSSFSLTDNRIRVMLLPDSRTALKDKLLQFCNDVSGHILVAIVDVYNSLDEMNEDNNQHHIPLTFTGCKGNVGRNYKQYANMKKDLGLGLGICYH